MMTSTRVSVSALACRLGGKAILAKVFLAILVQVFFGPSGGNGSTVDFRPKILKRPNYGRGHRNGFICSGRSIRDRFEVDPGSGEMDPGSKPFWPFWHEASQHLILLFCTVAEADATVLRQKNLRFKRFP